MASELGTGLTGHRPPIYPLLVTATIEAHAAERLANDTVGWLVTVRADGQPQASPVWFLFDGRHIYIQSEPTAAKLRNVAANARVSFHLNDNGAGSDIVTIDATAEILADTPNQLFAQYVAKYEAGIRQALGSTPEELAQTYSSTLRLTPTRVRTW
jgi:PPOX class probable F420-dependent enzyme